MKASTSFVFCNRYRNFQASSAPQKASCRETNFFKILGSSQRVYPNGSPKEVRPVSGSVHVDDIVKYADDSWLFADCSPLCTATTKCGHIKNWYGEEQPPSKCRQGVTIAISIKDIKIDSRPGIHMTSPYYSGSDGDTRFHVTIGPTDGYRY